MQDLYGISTTLMAENHKNAVAEAVVRLARQPGFARVREQSNRLIQHGRQRSYRGEVLTLYYSHKVSQWKY